MCVTKHRKSLSQTSKGFEIEMWYLLSPNIFTTEEMEDWKKKKSKKSIIYLILISASQKQQLFCHQKRNCEAVSKGS